MTVATKSPIRVALLTESFTAAAARSLRGSEMCRRCCRQVRVMAFRDTGYCCGRCLEAAK